MRIGTWNVEYATGAEKNSLRLEILQKHAADIWVLTETHDVLDLSSTHQAFRSHQRSNVPGARNVTQGSRWVTIWSRYSTGKLLRVCDDERTVATMLDIPAGRLMVYGTVLPWHSDRGKHSHDTIVRNWSEQYRVIDEQGREWRDLIASHPGVPLCVAGDLNLSLGGPHWYGTARGRNAICDSMRQSGLVCTTAYDRIPRGLLMHSPIDHVLLAEELAANSRVVAAWEGTTLDGIRLSDHSGLVVELGPAG